MYEVIVESRFSAAHSLREYDGNCERLHGHNWRVEATVAGRELDDLGMLIDFRQLKKHVAEVLDELDHRHLNDLPAFSAVNPTTENVARYIFDCLSKRLPESVRVRSVVAWETPGSGARYTADASSEG